jgi:hypothetical protein
MRARERNLRDRRLLEEAASERPELTFERLDRTALARVAAERGVELAAALFYDRVRRSEPHASFVAEIDAIGDDPPLPQLDGSLLVAPAAFYREHPRYGGDGRLVREVASRFGVESTTIGVASGGSVSDNARTIAEALLRSDGRPLVLVSMSKGAADLRVALESLGSRAPSVRAWVQVCGLAAGSPFADAILSSVVRCAATRAYFAYHGANFQAVRELSTAPGALLRGRPRAPDGCLVVNVVAVPLSHHLTGNARRRYALLSRFGPNDGGGLLLDSVVEPGLIYPVWGTDHYFQLASAERLLTRLFLYLHRHGALDER